MSEILKFSSEIIPYLNPYHPEISPEIKKMIFETKYHRDFIADGLEVGVFTYNKNNQLIICTKQSLESIKGFVFEAYAVRCINYNGFNQIGLSQIGVNCFNWATNRKRSINDKDSKNIIAIGTGFLTTRQTYPHYYEYSSNVDVKFLSKNIHLDTWQPEPIINSTIPAGIQIKAITTNVKEEIIQPLLVGKYNNVLTFLKNKQGIHTYYECMDVIKTLYINQNISAEERDSLENRIKKPEQIGMNQYEIDDYSKYIDYWYKGQALSNEDTDKAIYQEISGFKYSDSGILLPSRF